MNPRPRKPMGRPRRSAEATANRHIITLWIEETSVNFFLDRPLFVALEKWRIEQNLFNRSHAIKMQIVHCLRYPRNPNNPGLLAALDAWQKHRMISTRAGAVKEIIRRGIRVRNLWTAPISDSAEPPSP